MRAGDTVKHRPSGETWLVAVVEGDRVYWCGYPFGGSVPMSDCDVLKVATDEEYVAMLRDVAMVGPYTPSAIAKRQIALEKIVGDHKRVQAGLDRAFNVFFERAYPLIESPGETAEQEGVGVSADDGASGVVASGEESGEPAGGSSSLQGDGQGDVEEQVSCGILAREISRLVLSGCRVEIVIHPPQPSKESRSAQGGDA